MTTNSRPIAPGSGGRNASPARATPRAQEQAEQHPHAAEAVGEVAADRPQERAGNHAKRREDAGEGRARFQVVREILVLEKGVEEAGKSDEAAKRQRIEEAEPPGVGVAEDAAVVDERLGRRLVGAVLGQEEIHQEGGRQRGQGDGEYSVPAEGHGEHGAEEGGQRGAAVAGAGYPHRQTLVLRRIPAAGQRQGHGEARPGHAQHQADQQHLRQRVRPQPAEQQRHGRQRHADQAGAPGADAVGQEAEDQPEDGAAEERHGQHEGLERRDLPEVVRGRHSGRRRPEAVGDAHGQSADQHPDRKARIKIEKGAQERGPVAGLAEVAQVHG